MDGDRGLSDTWTGFTRFTILKEKAPDGFLLSGRRLTTKQTTSRPEKLWPEMWKHMSDASEREEKQNGPSKNQNSTMSEVYVVFTSLIQKMNSRIS